MPEYLSPGVYVEEVDRGAKPIEGVSTSTAGMVGFTERGPSNVPILVTSFPEYRRIFGGYLLPADHHQTWFFPHSIEGFFTNGGQRAYVVKINSPNAALASLDLMDRGGPMGFSGFLVGAAQAGDQFLFVDNTNNLVANGIFRITDGAATEYVTYLQNGNLANRLVPLRAPTYASLPANAVVRVIGNIDVGAPPQQALAAPAAAGANQITLDSLAAYGANLLVGSVLRIEAAANNNREYVVVSALPTDPSDTTLTLRQSLAFTHPQGVTNVFLIAPAQLAPTGAARTLAQGVGRGTGIVYLDAVAVAPNAGVIRLGAPGAEEYHVIAPLEAISLRVAASQPHASADPVAILTFNAAVAPNNYSTTLATPAAVGDTAVTITPLAPPAIAPAAGDWFQIGTGPTAEFAQVRAYTAPSVQLRQPLVRPHAVAANTFVRQTRNPGTPTTTLLQQIDVGGTTTLLADTVANFPVGSFVEIGTPQASTWEYREFAGVLNPDLIQVSAYGSVPATGLAFGHRADLRGAGRAVLLTLRAEDPGAWGNELRVKVVEEETALVQTTVAQNRPAGADIPLSSVTGVESGSLLEILDFSSQLTAYVPAGQSEITLASVAGLMFGDRLRLGRVDSEYVQIQALPGAGQVVLTQPVRRNHDAAEPVDRMDVGTGEPRMAKVARRTGANSVAFEPAGLAFAVNQGWVLRSREFALIIEWVKRGPANPRNPGLDLVIQTEVHRNLTLDDRHSRYIGTALGRTDGPVRLWDRRPDGGSDLVRTVDPLFGTNQIRTNLRPGPDLVVEVTRTGRRQPVGFWLTGGDDADATVTDNDYIGQDNVDPLHRTGLRSLRNHEEISLVAIPGRTNSGLHQEVIDHCEFMRYRMAVLDSVPGTPNTTQWGTFLTPAQLADVQAQRQQFDTKYAALYYPWLQIPNPLDGPGLPAELTAPPSGFMLGRYAFTDITRGVHKAPANEVILGITGLQRSLTKGEQDILNPSPVNINVLRDFREQTRGLRIWGARIVTSDTEWKYVNVRRLFLYLERSMDVGTQWVVFEPNDFDTWARVTRTLTNFLTAVWRDGALMGRTAEEAFYVKCDRTTMTQNDIDNGRLIVQIGVAPVKPAEFVIIRIGQWQGGSSLQEG